MSSRLSLNQGSGMAERVEFGLAVDFHVFRHYIGLQSNGRLAGAADPDSNSYWRSVSRKSGLEGDTSDAEARCDPVRDEFFALGAVAESADAGSATNGRREA